MVYLCTVIRSTRSWVLGVGQGGRAEEKGKRTYVVADVNEVGHINL